MSYFEFHSDMDSSCPQFPWKEAGDKSLKNEEWVQFVAPPDQGRPVDSVRTPALGEEGACWHDVAPGLGDRNHVCLRTGSGTHAPGILCVCSGSEHLDNIYNHTL